MAFASTWLVTPASQGIIYGITVLPSLPSLEPRVPTSNLPSIPSSPSHRAVTRQKPHHAQTLQQVRLPEKTSMYRASNVQRTYIPHKPLAPVNFTHPTPQPLIPTSNLPTHRHLHPTAQPPVKNPTRSNTPTRPPEKTQMHETSTKTAYIPPRPQSDFLVPYPTRHHDTHP